MNETIRSAVAWLAVWFLSLELPAHFHLSRWQTLPCLLAAVAVVIVLWPIYTLSSTAWHGIAWWSVVALLIFVAGLVLLAHFDLHWSVKWLLVVAFASVALIVSHAVERLVK